MVSVCKLTEIKLRYQQVNKGQVLIMATSLGSQLTQKNRDFVSRVQDWAIKCESAEKSLGAHPATKTLRVLREQMTANAQDTGGTYPTALGAIARVACDLCTQGALPDNGLTSTQLERIGGLFDELAEAIEQLKDDSWIRRRGE